MLDGSRIASAPFWAIFVGTLVLVLLAVEGGYSWAKSKRGSAREKEREKEGPVGAMVGTVLGLLALMLAFTFSKAGDHYHERRVALFDEANAIRSMYSATILIEEPQRAEIRKLLRNYVDERLQWDGSDRTRDTSTAAALLDRLSARTAAVLEKNPSPVVVSLLLRSTTWSKPMLPAVKSAAIASRVRSGRCCTSSPSCRWGRWDTTAVFRGPREVP